MGQELKLNEFKILYRHWKAGIPWLDHLLLGLLVWIEQKLVDNRVKVEVDEAIKTWETLHVADMVSPVYEESPSDTSTSLPEMRLTAPWYIDTVDKE